MSLAIKIVLAVIIFMIGFNANRLMSETDIRTPFSESSIDIASPSQKISANQIQVFPDKAIIDFPNLKWARIENTHSMEPVLNQNSFSLEITPSSESEIKIGDIISFSLKNKIIIHRVILTGSDEEGWYAVTKGDNNQENDPEKVRFNQINGIVVGIVY